MVVYNQIKTSIRGVLLALLVVGFLNPASGQLNESDTMKVQIRVGINGIHQTGNVDLVILRTRLEIVGRLSESLVFKSQNNTLYQEFSGWKADDDINSRNFLYFNPQQRVYPFAMAYLQTNYRLNINLRYFAGVGGTWQVVRNENHILKFSGSVVYEETDYTVNNFNDSFYNGNTEIKIWRPTVYLIGTSRFSNNKIRLHYTAYWQPGIEQVSNQRFQAETGFEFNVWKGLSFTTQYLFIYEEVVPMNVKQKDALLTVGINYQFKK